MIEDRIAVLLGGRAAQQLICNGVVSTGAAADLEIRSRESRFLQLPGMEERNDSEHTARRIDDAARAKLESIYRVQLRGTDPP